MSKAQIDAKFTAEGRCRLCLRPSRVRQLTRHRLVPGSMRGTYVVNNCVPLCRPCHDLVDHRDREIRDSARRMLRALLWPVEIGHILSRLSEKTFDARYPRPTREVVMSARAPTWTMHKTG